MDAHPHHGAHPLPPPDNEDDDFRPPEDRSDPARWQHQCGAVPWRRRAGNGPVEVCIVSSRRGYWLVPKGGVDPGRTPPEMAAIEAWEEAGVRGVIHEPALGSFVYEKGGGIGCVVEMYALRVTEVVDAWPEDHFRDRRWLLVPQAARIVRWPAMGEIIRRLGASLDA